MLRWIKLVFLSTVYTFLYIPLIVLIIESLKLDPFVHTGTTHWTGQWYVYLWHNPESITALLYSILLGCVVSIATIICSLFCAFCLYQYNFYGKWFIQWTYVVLLIAPEIEMVVIYLLFFSFFFYPATLWVLFIVHLCLCMPFTMSILMHQLSHLPPYLLDSAKDLGAKNYNMIFHIVLPILKNSLIKSFYLNFMLSVDNVIANFFFSQPSFPLLSNELYAQIKLGVHPETAALCVVFLVFMSIINLLHYGVKK